MKDTVSILRALAAHNPFSLDTNNNLRNIMSAVTADSNINADTAKSVGEKILSSMNGMLATDYPLTEVPRQSLWYQSPP